MQWFIIVFLALLCLVELMVLLVSKIELRRVRKKLMLSRKACFFLCNYGKGEKRRQLENINDIFVQISCDDTQITTDLAVVEQAAEMLMCELNEEEKQNCLE